MALSRLRLNILFFGDLALSADLLHIADIINMRISIRIYSDRGDHNLNRASLIKS